MNIHLKNTIINFRRLLYCICLVTSQTMGQQNISALTGVQTSEGIFISFTTVQGVSCLDAELQHSSDSIFFTTIYTIPGICGSAFNEESYSYLHTNPVINAVNYYRINLRASGYSGFIGVKFFNYGSSPLHISPMPITDVSNLHFEGNNKANEILIFDLKGRLVLKTHTLQNDVSINAAPLNNGLYVLQLFQDRLLKHSRLISVKK
ncbi:MAG: T9SS type A sorting domain-containing protein [Bacteroidia bacterium]|nr:T9SS type A sorting domain-containing protein [Bacteroidia bacterium]